MAFFIVLYKIKNTVMVFYLYSCYTVSFILFPVVTESISLKSPQIRLLSLPSTACRNIGPIPSYLLYYYSSLENLQKIERDKFSFSPPANSLPLTVTNFSLFLPNLERL